MADNVELKVMEEGLENLTLAFKIAFSKHKKAIGYSVERGCLILYWTDPKIDNFVHHIFTMDYSKAATFAFDWLSQTEYPKEPHQDGHNGKGWVVYRDYWGHVNEHSSAILAVKPNWVMYGK